jgi:hypothetical protein
VADSLHPLGLVSDGQTKRSRDIAGVVERYFQISLFLLIATGFITLMGTNRLDALSVVFVCLALLLRGYLLLKQREFKIPEKWTTYFTLMYLLVFAVDLFVISGSYVTASVHLVLFSLVVKIFSVQRERDYVYLAVLAFLAVLAASVLTVDTVFLGSFFIFVLLAVNTFVSMEMRRSLKHAVHSGEPAALPRGPRQLSVSLSALAAFIVIGIIVGSAGLFFLLPRFSAGYLSSFAPQSELVTGFGDQVILGEIGRIKQTDTVVMHVQMDNAEALDLKWRGIALTVFDGKMWRNQANEQDVLLPTMGRFALRRLQLGRRNLAPALEPNGFRLVRYRVVMEPIGTNVLFMPATPVELAGRFREISVDETGSVTNTDRSRVTESYEAVSQVAQFTPERLRALSGVYPPDVAMLYLQHPPMDPRVYELSSKVTANARSDYDKAAALEQYLRANYAYTLNLGNVVPADPIAWFLFERKEGHCEYFASAMAVMLRSIGIPSRIVNGFRNGEYNDLTGNYIIRGRDAHTWVEAYMPSVGWTTFDPTPPDPQPTGNTFSRMRLYLDAAQEFWREWIINYDFGHQRELTVSTVSKAQRSAYDVRRWWRQKYNALLRQAQRINDRVSTNPQRTVMLVVAALVGFVLLWNLRYIIRSWRQRSIARKPSKAPQLAATIWYSRMLKTVARKGYPKHATQTPSEFVRSIPEASLRQSVSQFTERYERARFGESVQDAEQLPAIYEEIAGKK